MYYVCTYIDLFFVGCYNLFRMLIVNSKQKHGFTKEKELYFLLDSGLISTTTLICFSQLLVTKTEAKNRLVIVFQKNGCLLHYYNNKLINNLQVYAQNSPNTITPVAPAFSQTLALSINVHDPLLTTQTLPRNNSASTNCNEQALLLLGISFTYRQVKNITVCIRSKTFLGTFHNKCSDDSPMIVNQRATNLHRGFPRTRR